MSKFYGFRACIVLSTLASPDIVMVHVSLVFEHYFPCPVFSSLDDLDILYKKHLWMHSTFFSGIKNDLTRSDSLPHKAYVISVADQDRTIGLNQ